MTEYEIIYESHPIPLIGVLMDEHTLITALARGDLCSPVIVQKPGGQQKLRVTPTGLEPFKGVRDIFTGSSGDPDEETLQEMDEDPQVWFGIRGFPKYQMNDAGQIRSLSRVDRRILKPQMLAGKLRLVLRDKSGKPVNLTLTEIRSLKE